MDGAFGCAFDVELRGEDDYWKLLLTEELDSNVGLVLDDDDRERERLDISGSDETSVHFGTKVGHSNDIHTHSTLFSTTKYEIGLRGSFHLCTVFRESAR